TTVATLVADGTAVRAETTANGEFGALFAPWLPAPAIAASANAVRTIPPCAGAAAAIAASDNASGNCNLAAAGANGVLSYIDEDTAEALHTFTDSERQTLNEA